MSRTEIEIIKDGKIVAADLAPDSVLTAAIGNLQVTTAKIADRSVTAQKLDASINFFPSGGIVMWNGSAATIPSGWTLCDGTNGTPDLRDRFIVGAGRNYSPNATGGSDTVTLNLSQIPSHSHSISGGGSHSHSGSTSGDGSHTHTGTTSNETANHFHSGTTDNQGLHQHAMARDSGNSNVNTQSDRYALATNNNVGRDYVQAAGAHAHNFNTGGASGPHAHNISISGGGHSHGISINSVVDHTHGMSTVGSDAAHENRPPYYALCFIMKT